MLITALKPHSKGAKSAGGFSLVEILVVLLIIGLGYSIISINVGGNDSYHLRTEAKKFANATALIAEEAVLANRQWGVDIYREDKDGLQQYGYRWLQQDKEGLWQVANYRDEESEFLFTAGIALSLYLEGAEQELEIGPKRAQLTDSERLAIADLQQEPEEPLLPTLWLLSSGEMSAFEIQLSYSEDPQQTVTIMGDQLGRVTLETKQQDE